MKRREMERRGDKKSKRGILGKESMKRRERSGKKISKKKEKEKKKALRR